MEDLLGYLIKTHDGRILKSGTLHILSMNFGIIVLLAVVSGIMFPTSAQKEPENAPFNVDEPLDELRERSVKLIGKPAAPATKDDKINAIQFLSGAGAFLIAKNGDKASRYSGISKYTLYRDIGSGKKSGGKRSVPCIFRGI